jgi:L-seryl-tRNA(Ser) seleniumtransferase
MSNSQLRQLPGISQLLELAGAAPLLSEYGHARVVDALRSAVEAARQTVMGGTPANPSAETILARAAAQLRAQSSPSLHSVINATGVVVHTNLGRAPLSERALRAAAQVSQGYCNLEYDTVTGERGSRYVHAAETLCRLTGAEDALVVNNNAAAVLLTLTALAHERQVIIGRSQLVEIGGGFRIPDVMRQSGARLVEVGTTNRTYVADYADAIHPINTALILRVHHSNFSITGFVHEPTLPELVALGEAHGVPVLDDLGSGTLLDTAAFGLAHEPTVQESIAAGAALVTASGDKLLGGPQAGLILGRADLISRLRQHPLARALRVDKVTLAALQATLLAYLEGKAVAEIPVWRMIAASPQALRQRVRRWQRRLASGDTSAAVIPTQSAVGGGSLPGQTLPTHALALTVPSPDGLAARLRQPRRSQEPTVIARIEAGRVLFDPRTVLPEQDDQLIEVLRAALADVAYADSAA